MMSRDALYRTDTSIGSTASFSIMKSAHQTYRTPVGSNIDAALSKYGLDRETEPLPLREGGVTRAASPRYETLPDVCLFFG